MALFRKRLHERIEREESQGWYEPLFNWSSWLNTRVSTLTGTLILLMLALTSDPCIINVLVRFLKEQISIIQLMILKQQYQLTKMSRI